MAINAESRILNIRRSFNKHINYVLIADPPSPICFVNFGGLSSPVPSNYDTWLNIHWLSSDIGTYGECRVQLDIQSKVIKDKLGNKVADLADTVMGAMNTNTIVLYDFADPQNLIDLSPYLLIPRLQEVGDLPTLLDSQVRGILLDYKLFLSYGSILE